jgi:hypothetical protein
LDDAIAGAGGKPSSFPFRRDFAQADTDLWTIGMTHFEDNPPPVMGVYWIDEDDYPALLKIFEDGNKMPATWKEWLKIAEEMRRGLEAYGHVVMRVRIDPLAFPVWCAAHGTGPNGEGRKKFIAAAVNERYGSQN